MDREKMNIVIVGHVDHGKSTVIGRLLADTKSLPEGKLEAIKERCKRESKIFEYAFLLDALHDEQDQGITIDSARCFFKTKKRDYIIIDAPGHIEFLKNMISGAARAEAALLVIDAKEGIQENSKRHGYMLSMLGIKQVVVLVNKMDLVDYDENRFNEIKKDYTEFLKKINVKPKEFIPISALEGENIAADSSRLRWYKGNNVLSALDSFEKSPLLEKKPFRMPVQGVYKFTDEGDSRRIVAGRVESGNICVGDKVMFLPSNKSSKIKSIETFNSGNKKNAIAGESVGFTLDEQIYVNRGDIMCKQNEKLPFTSSLISASIFWMSKEPMTAEKEYHLKIGTSKIAVRLKKINKILDASDLSNSDKKNIERHDVAECMLECLNPIAFDISSDIESTGRFVIVDNYKISGGGIITEYVEDDESKIRDQVILREKKWYHGGVDFKERANRYGQRPKLIIITGKKGLDKMGVAKCLERMLFDSGRKAYFLGIGNLLRGLDADIDKEKREEHIRRLGETAHILMDAGLIVISTASDLDEHELKLIQTINDQRDIFIVNIGENIIDNRLIELNLDDEKENEINALKIFDMLKFKNIMFSM